MRIAVSAHARKRGFQMARHLLAKGMLSRLHTAYPAFKTRRFASDLAAVTSHHSLPFLVTFALRRAFPRLDRRLLHAIDIRYDDLAARSLKPCDLVHGWSGQMLRTMRRARELGALCVVDRASAHIRVQDRILAQESERFGIHLPRPLPAGMDREEQEYALADAISIPSSFVRRSFLEMGVPDDKLIQIPYAVDVSTFHPVAKEDDVFRVVHCGGVNYAKGVHYLVRAFLSLKLKNAELWLIGGMEPAFKEFLDAYAHDTVRYIGRVPQNELHRYYSQADAFCMASIHEGMALVIPEAMACGLPVICTDSSGGEDVVEDGVQGFVVPAGDEEALAGRITWFHGHRDEGAAMGQAALEKVRGRSTWEGYTARLIEAYEALLGKRAS